MNILELNDDEIMALGKCIYNKVGTNTELLNSDTPLMSALDKILKAMIEIPRTQVLTYLQELQKHEKSK